MRVPAAVVVSALLTPFLSAQTYDWRQSPATGRLYAVTQPVTWHQARAQAQAFGGDLAVVRSADEQAWLFDQFGGSQSLWIGFTDAAVEGTWVWASGSTANYTNWAAGQPDNQGGAENWAALSPLLGWPQGSNGQWHDLPATFACPGIIELEPGAIGGALPFFAGCPGTNGTPALSPVGSAPAPGSLFPVRFDNLPTQAGVVIAALGLPHATGIDLAQFGMPGCGWHVDHFSTTLLSAMGASSLQWSFPVHGSPLLRGVQIRLQGLVVDPGANAAGATVTNPMAMFYGYHFDEVSMCESFLNDAQLHRSKSGGEWTGGDATFASIGGDGRHGTFDVTVFTPVGTIGGLDTYVINTDGTVIPASMTPSGTTIIVTDGRFFFDEMTVAANVRLRFVGSNAPQFTVAGKLEILGEIDVQGQTLSYPSSTVAPFGQIGGAGGPFGGKGGDGGDKCLGNGAAPAFNGKNGESANVLAGRAYATTTNGTGGVGSTIHPPSGLSSALFYAPGIVTYTPDATAGGSGGGLFTVGQQSTVTNNHNDPVTGVPPRLSALGASPPAGTPLQFFPFPPLGGSTRSSTHFLAGGSGGGGAGSNAALAINVVRSWAAGCGGGGGGGAVACRAGDSLIVSAAARILANGGSGGSILAQVGATAAPAPAGGGSGGSVVLQTGNGASIAGQVNVLGGLGGTYDRSAGGLPPSGAHVIIHGGDGASGIVRFEAPNAPTVAMLPNAMPAATPNNVGALTEADEFASVTSRFYDTRLVVPPQWKRYEIEALVDGVPVTFSDDPAVSPMAASDGAALRASFQSGINDPPSQSQTFGPWRPAVRSSAGVFGMDVDLGTFYRFRLVQDRAVAASVVVQSFKVVYGN